MARPSALVTKVAALGFPLDTPSPFLFAVFHSDLYPAGNPRDMTAPRAGDGSDFNPAQAYRMYHGETIPGFPQHPHRGFETLTVTLEGLVDHADSLGSGGRYGDGDLQWMSAGSGVMHQEMFPLIHTDRPNTLRLYQLWLNLPAASKMTPPAYTMIWAETVPRVAGERGGHALLYAGRLGGRFGGTPPPHSWASDPAHEVGVFVLRLPRGGGAFTLPPAPPGVNRRAFVTAGAGVTISDGSGSGGSPTPPTATVHLVSTLPARFSNESSEKDAEVLVLQGVPINEPVAQRGPFVMNTEAELRTAMDDYRATSFGGWPWDDDVVVFDRARGRFASRPNPSGGEPLVEVPPTGGEEMTIAPLLL